MTNTKRNISVVLADTQFLTNEALRAMLTPLYKAFYTVSTKAGLQQYLVFILCILQRGPGMIQLVSARYRVV